MKFFTWTTGTVEASVGGGFLSTVVSGAIAVGAVRASAGGIGGASAVDQARLMSAQLGSPGPGTSPPQGGRADTTPPGPGPAGPGPVPGSGTSGGPGMPPSGSDVTAGGAGTAATPAGSGGGQRRSDGRGHWRIVRSGGPLQADRHSRRSGRGSKWHIRPGCRRPRSGRCRCDPGRV